TTSRLHTLSLHDALPISSYSRIIQAAEALGKSRDVLRNTYTSCAWQDELLNKSEDMMFWKYVDANFAHLLDPNFSGYPATKTVRSEEHTSELQSLAYLVC